MTTLRIAVLAIVLAGTGTAQEGVAAEASPPGERAFDRLDANHDGLIDREEFQAAAARWRALRGPDAPPERRAGRAGPVPEILEGGGEHIRGLISQAMERVLRERDEQLHHAFREMMERTAREREEQFRHLVQERDEQMRHLIRDVVGSLLRERFGPDGPMDGSPPLAGPRRDRFRAFAGGRGEVGERRPKGPGRGEGAGRFARPDRPQRERRQERIRERQSPTGDQPRAAKSGLIQRLKQMDRNGDGVVTRDEFDGRPKTFDRLDRNGDGRITLREARRGTRDQASGERPPAKRKVKGEPARGKANEGKRPPPPKSKV